MKSVFLVLNDEINSFFWWTGESNVPICLLFGIKNVRCSLSLLLILVILRRAIMDSDPFS